MDDETEEPNGNSRHTRGRLFVKEGELAVCAQPGRLKLVYIDGTGDCGWATKLTDM